jgi:hypothetical protein
MLLAKGGDSLSVSIERLVGFGDNKNGEQVDNDGPYLPRCDGELPASTLLYRRFSLPGFWYLGSAVIVKLLDEIL